MELKEIQEKARCNWCLAALINFTKEITESNFVDTGRKFSNGDKAYAVYCNECIANETRVKSPKSAINRNTGDTIDLEFLPSVEKEKETSTVKKAVKEIKNAIK